MTYWREFFDLKTFAPHGDTELLDFLQDKLPIQFARAGIKDREEIRQFLAQMATETNGFRTLNEYWGPTPAQRGYQTHRHLGNTEEGDGYRYRGRGLVQLTGRHNYHRYGERLGLDLVNNPDLAADIDNIIPIAIDYWIDKDLGRPAREGNLRRVTQLVNGGDNALSKRERYRDRLMTMDIQDWLNRHGADIAVDGDFGPLTAEAVKDFQRKRELAVDGIVGPETLKALRPAPLPHPKHPVDYTALPAEGPELAAAAPAAPEGASPMRLPASLRRALAERIAGRGAPSPAAREISLAEALAGRRMRRPG